jgi:hypothetical protein
MERKVTGQDGAIDTTSPDVSEKAGSSLLNKTEASSQSSGTVSKTVAKTKPGGVKLGSFRLGARKKTDSGEDSGLEAKESKRKSKKSKKVKNGDDSDKQESEGSAASTSPQSTKRSFPSKATSLVRKLSDKYRPSGSKRSFKSADTPSSQDEYQSVSTEEECFLTESPSAVTSGHKGLEVADPVGQWTDSKGHESDCSIADQFTQTTLGNKDSKPVLETSSEDDMDMIDMIIDEAFRPTRARNSVADNLADVRTCAVKSGGSKHSADANSDIVVATHSRDTAVGTSSAEGSGVSEREVSNGDDGGSEELEAEMTLTTRYQIEAITTPVMKRSGEEEQRWKEIDEGYAQFLKECTSDHYDDYGVVDYENEKPRYMRHGFKSPDDFSHMMILASRMAVSSYTMFQLLNVFDKISYCGLQYNFV